MQSVLGHFALRVRRLTDKHDLRVEMQAGEIVVTMAGTNFKAVFQKFPGVPQLVANWHAIRDKRVAEAKRAQFLTSAWKLATNKARELGWIV
jgi:hypothetical protein